MSKPAKRAAKPRSKPSSAVPEISRVSPPIPQRYSQHSPDSQHDAKLIDVERLTALELVAESHECYQADKNPLWMWLAIADARAAGIGLPDWTLDYLTRAATLISAKARGKTVPAAAEIMRALELAGVNSKRTSFTEFAKARRDLSLAASVYAFHVAPARNPKRPLDRTVEAGVARVAETAGVSEQTVWRAWTRYGNALASASGRLMP